jgi:hypothetical protein
MLMKLNLLPIRPALVLLPGLLASLSPRAPAALTAGEPCSVTPHASWKSSVSFPADPFLVDPWPNPRWVKFTVLRCDPSRVYFQDGRVYQFHYDFASKHLGPFLGLTRAQFDAKTLYRQGQEAVLGAVIFPPSIIPNPTAFGIQLVGKDPYPPDEVIALFKTVAAKVTGSAAQALYFPAFEQKAPAEENAAYLAEQGVRLGSPDRWADGNAVYADGWALGRLRFVEAGSIQDAYESGELRPSDILLTDGVPAEVPFVQGILSLAPATPNSHVAILARSYGSPFAYLALEEDAQRAQGLVGREVIVSAYNMFWRTELRLYDVGGLLDEGMKSEILDLKKLPALELTPIAPSGVYSRAVAELGPGDIGRVGGKAAHYGLLLRAIPQNALTAAALTFDAWLEFLDQPLLGGLKLREEIASRLAPFASYPPSDFKALATALEGVRDLIEDETSFSPGLRAAIVATLQDPRYGFDSSRNFRFRSSTNVEDSAQFTGAGLYESRSGCLLDDLDGDASGPSLCDPTESEERGVFRALRKVFASFYFDNAYLERRRWGVDEGKAGMAVLIHHSFPDSFELANGVATLSRSGPNYFIEMVTQVGATSVTNPSGGSIPETVQITVFSTSTAVELVQESNLVQLGGRVLAWTKEYEKFADLFVAVAKRFETETGKHDFTLDFEYKKTAPGDQLIVKQVREIPAPNPTKTITPFLLGVPSKLEVFQGEAPADAFANHRLKSSWEITTRSTWITAQALRSGAIVRLKYQTSDGCSPVTFDGDPGDLPQFETSYGPEGTLRARWSPPGIPNVRKAELTIQSIPLQVSVSRSPFFTLDDLPAYYCSTYLKPVLGFDEISRRPGLRSEETVALAARPGPRGGDLPQTRTIAKGGIAITVGFYWPPFPTVPTAGYTAPLIRWVETTIEGLTSERIVLKGERSQTYQPEHHNFSEHFVFEPHQEPGLSPSILAELEAKDVRWIHAFVGQLDSSIETHGACELVLDCACRVESVPFRRGDCNDDGTADLSDVVCQLSWLFTGGATPGCVSATNANGDERTDLSDAIHLLSFLFLGGSPPADPFPACGPGTLPSDPASGCATFKSCGDAGAQG